VTQSTRYLLSGRRGNYAVVFSQTLTYVMVFIYRPIFTGITTDVVNKLRLFPVGKLLGIVVMELLRARCLPVAQPIASKH